jgi:hypothetical protein
MNGEPKGAEPNHGPLVLVVDPIMKLPPVPQQPIHPDPSIPDELTGVGGSLKQAICPQYPDHPAVLCLNHTADSDRGLVV